MWIKQTHSCETGVAHHGPSLLPSIWLYSLANQLRISETKATTLTNLLDILWKVAYYLDIFSLRCWRCFPETESSVIQTTATSWCYESFPFMLAWNVPTCWPSPVIFEVCFKENVRQQKAIVSRPLLALLLHCWLGMSGP